MHQLSQECQTRRHDKDKMRALDFNKTAATAADTEALATRLCANRTEETRVMAYNGICIYHRVRMSQTQLDKAK